MGFAQKKCLYFGLCVRGFHASFVRTSPFPGQVYDIRCEAVNNVTRAIARFNYPGTCINVAVCGKQFIDRGTNRNLLLNEPVMGARHYVLSPAKRARRCFFCLAILGSVVAGTAYANLHKGGWNIGETIIASAATPENKQPPSAAANNPPDAAHDAASPMKLTMFEALIPSH